MKKIITISAAIIVLTSICNVNAQQWSDEQKEVWKSVQTYNDLSVNRDDAFINYFDDSYRGWEYESDAPSDKDAVKKYITHRNPNTKTLYIVLTPAAIWVNGNFAYVHYYYVSVSEDKESKRTSEKGRWTDILIKKDGKWIMIGDHGGSTSDDD